jgi:serine protease Do
MKISRRFAALTMAGAGILLLAGHAPFNCSVHAASPPKLKFNEAAVSPQIKAATSLSPIIKEVSPSVVNIHTSKKVKTMSRPMPYFDDPLFWQFFGDPRGGVDPVPRERREQSLGSGVILSEDGYILTNNHVVDGADEIKISLADDKTIFDAKVIGTDTHTDIAVLKVEGRNLPAITLTDSDKLEVGDFVLAIGNPFGVGQTVTAGIVSAKGRGGMGIVDYEDFIQTDASINPGNSGGALVDAEGRLVGINTAILSRTGGNQGVGFAVPINLARYVMERLVTDGKVTRGYLGVMIQSVTPGLAKEFELKDQSGALIGEVTPKSPAEEAGLKDGDVVVEFKGKQVTDSRHLRLMVAQSAPGTKVTLKVIRNGEELIRTAKLGELPAEGLAKASGGGGRSWGGGGKGDALRGAEVADLDARTRRQFDIPATVRGAVITSVEPDSAAADAGLRPGDVIVEINRRNVTSADDALEFSGQTKGDRLLLRVWRDGGSHFVVMDISKSR